MTSQKPYMIYCRGLKYMNREYEKTLEILKKEIEKLTPEQAELYKQFIDDQTILYTRSTIISERNKLRQLIVNVDPLNWNEKYIFNTILAHRARALDFYRYLYKNEYLGSEYRFLNKRSPYKIIQELCDKNLSAKNVVCCNMGSNEYCQIVFTQNRAVIHMIQDFYDGLRHTYYLPSFVDYIALYLDKHNVNCNEDLSDALIEDCILNAPNYNTALNCRYFLAQCISKIKDKSHFKLYPMQILSRSTLCKEILEGYKTVYYNKIDKVPTFDKWLLLPNEEAICSTQMTSESVLPFNFSRVQNKQLRDILKEWVWVTTNSIRSRNKVLHIIVDFLNMFFLDNNKHIIITQSICANYKSFVQSKWNIHESRSARIHTVLSFVHYLDDYTPVTVEKECYFYLRNLGTSKHENAESVKKEHLEMIAAYMNDHKNDNHNSLCYYVMFHIALNTEFRISQIVTLPVDCVQESVKANEYVIRTNMKQSGYEQVNQPCARVVKDIIFAYLNATEDYRSNLDPSLRKFLFVNEYYLTTIKQPFKFHSFSNYLKNVCKKLNLPSYTAKNLRVTYITNAKEYALRNGLSDLTLLGVTNHKHVDTINNHYIHEKIVDALQATIGVIIGDVNIDGTISENSTGFDTSKDAMVANGVGFCQSVQCTNQGPLPCQKCKHFFTTLENIPYYQKEIDRLKAINNGTLNPHDAEDINNLIRMNTYILGELINLKKRMKGDY